MSYSLINLLVFAILLFLPHIVHSFVACKIKKQSCLSSKNSKNEIDSSQDYYSGGITSIKRNIFDNFQKNLITSSMLTTFSYYAVRPAFALDAVQDVELSTNSLLSPNTESASNSASDAAKFSSQIEKTRALLSDEFIITFNNTDLGIAITESMYNGFPVCTVSKIFDTKLIVSHRELRIGAIVTKIDDTKVDGIPLRQIAKLIKESSRPVVIQFRDPNRYFELLETSKFAESPAIEITSSYLPANARDAGAPEQIIKIQRLELPTYEKRGRSAELFDVMEIQYVAQVAGESSAIVDSSADRCPPGSSTRSIYYVLGQRNGPPGSYPPGWDLTLRGMVVGEKRRIVLPYTLAYERKGNKERNIPPFATMIYTVRLISLT